MPVSRPTPIVPPIAIVETDPKPFVRVENPRVQVHPSPDGIVLLIGVTLEGKWVAEYRCLAEDYDERCVAAMERRVRAKERKSRPRPKLI